jgi:hypothetical protein
VDVNTLEEWVKAVCAELGIHEAIDRDQVLNLTRDVAHAVARPAAPVTAYLVGLAAGRSGDPLTGTADAVRRVDGLVARWPRVTEG